jgi:hypothetical protein
LNSLSKSLVWLVNHLHPAVGLPSYRRAMPSVAETLSRTATVMTAAPKFLGITTAYFYQNSSADALFPWTKNAPPPRI